MAEIVSNDIISEEKQLKFVFIGDEGTGKTSLILSCMREEFKEVGPTLIIDFKRITVRIKDKIYKINFWDTPQKVSYFGPTPYYRGADVIILTIDGTKPFDKERINYWLDYIRRDNPNPSLPIIITLTKKDQQINEKQVKQYAEQHHYTFISTSSKNNEGTEELFFECIKQSSNKNQHPVVNIKEQRSNDKCQN